MKKKEKKNVKVKIIEKENKTCKKFDIECRCGFKTCAFFFFFSEKCFLEDLLDKNSVIKVNICIFCSNYNKKQRYFNVEGGKAKKFLSKYSIDSKDY